MIQVVTPDPSTEPASANRKRIAPQTRRQQRPGDPAERTRYEQQPVAERRQAERLPGEQHEDGVADVGGGAERGGDRRQSAQQPIVPQPSEPLGDLAPQRRSLGAHRTRSVGPGHHRHQQGGRGEAQRVDTERRGDRQTEQQAPQRRTDEIVRHQLGRRQATTSTFEVTLIDRRRDQRHARTVDDRLRRRQQRGNHVDRHDRHAVERDHRDEQPHQDRAGDVETHPEDATIEPVGPGSPGQDEDQPRKALCDRDPGDQPRVGRDRGRQQGQGDDAQPVADVGQRGRSPQELELGRERPAGTGRGPENGHAGCPGRLTGWFSSTIWRIVLRSIPLVRSRAERRALRPALLADTPTRLTLAMTTARTDDSSRPDTAADDAGSLAAGRPWRDPEGESRRHRHRVRRGVRTAARLDDRGRAADPTAVRLVAVDRRRRARLRPVRALDPRHAHTVGDPPAGVADRRRVDRGRRTRIGCDRGVARARRRHRRTPNSTACSTACSSNWHRCRSPPRPVTTARTRPRCSSAAWDDASIAADERRGTLGVDPIGTWARIGRHERPRRWRGGRSGSARHRTRRDRPDREGRRRRRHGLARIRCDRRPGAGLEHRRRVPRRAGLDRRRGIRSNGRAHSSSSAGPPPPTSSRRSPSSAPPDVCGPASPRSPGSRPRRARSFHHADASRVMMTRYDPWVNALRSTVACFAAGMGGADAVTILPHDGADHRRRHLARTADRPQHPDGAADGEQPGPRDRSRPEGRGTSNSSPISSPPPRGPNCSGSKRAGGIIAAVTAGDVHESLATARATRDRRIAVRKQPLTGLTEFPDILETPPPPEPAPPIRRHHAVRAAPTRDG